MKTLLKVVYAGIFVSMIAVTSWAQMQEGFLSCLRRIPSDPWFVATLFDTYFAFFCFWLWLAFRERSVVKSILWAVLIVLGGNITMSVYVLMQLFRLKPEEPASAILRPAQG